MKDPCFEIIYVLDRAYKDGLDQQDDQYRGQLIKIINSSPFSLRTCWEKIDWLAPEPAKSNLLVLAALNAEEIGDTAFAIAQLLMRQPDIAFHIITRASQERGLSEARLWCALFWEQHLDNVSSQVRSTLFQVFEKHAPSCFEDKFDSYYMTYVSAKLGSLPTISLEFLAASERVNPLYRGLGLHFLFQRLPPSMVKSHPVCEQLLSLIEDILSKIGPDPSKTIDLSSLSKYDNSHFLVMLARKSIEVGWRDSLAHWKEHLSQYCAP